MTFSLIRDKIAETGKFARESKLLLGRLGEFALRETKISNTEIERRGRERHGGREEERDERPGDQQSENSVVGGRL